MGFQVPRHQAAARCPQARLCLEAGFSPAPPAPGTAPLTRTGERRSLPRILSMASKSDTWKTCAAVGSEAISSSSSRSAYATPTSKDADASAARPWLQAAHQVLAAAVGQQDGHLLEGAVPRAAAGAARRLVACDEAPSARVRVAAVLGQLPPPPRAPRGPRTKRPSSKGRGRGGVRCKRTTPTSVRSGPTSERVHQVGHPLRSSRVLLAHARGGVQHEHLPGRSARFCNLQGQRERQGHCWGWRRDRRVPQSLSPGPSCSLAGWRGLGCC